MGSSYIRNFINSSDISSDVIDEYGYDEKVYKNDVIKVLNDLENGDGLKHYLRLNVSDSTSGNRGGIKVDWKRRFCTSNYTSMLLKEYQTYFKGLEIDGGYSLLNSKGKDVVDYFLEKNNISKLIKKIAKQRKKCGDVYVYYFIKDENDSSASNVEVGLTGDEDVVYDAESNKYKTINFRVLESEKVEIIPDLDGEPLAYIYTDKKKSRQRNQVPVAEGGRINLFDEVNIETKIIFMRGAIYVYKNNELQQQQDLKEFGFSNKFPLIHMQFEKEDGKVYSKNPCEDIVDYHLELDRIESSVKYINNLSGHTQMVIVDGAVDEEASDFGANSIVYVDSLESEDALGEIKHQAKVDQLEIKNELQTLKDEKEDKEEKIYKTMNLPSIKTYRELLKTENSKVWENVRKSLESEIRDFYEDFIFKFKDVFEVLLRVNEIKLPKKPVKFKMPEFIIEPSIFDVYLLKAQKMNMKELSVQKNLKELGLTEEEIKKELDNWRMLEILTTVAKESTSTTSSSSNSSVLPAVQKQSDTKQLDNKAKPSV